MRASIGQVSSPIIMSLVDSLMRTMSGFRSVCRKSCRFLSRSAVSWYPFVLISFECSNAFLLVVCKSLSCLHAIRLNEFPGPRRNVPECVQGFPACRQSRINEWTIYLSSATIRFIFIVTQPTKSASILPVNMSCRFWNSSGAVNSLTHQRGQFILRLTYTNLFS